MVIDQRQAVLAILPVRVAGVAAGNAAAHVGAELHHRQALVGGRPRDRQQLLAGLGSEAHVDLAEVSHRAGVADVLGHPHGACRQDSHLARPRGLHRFLQQEAVGLHFLDLHRLVHLRPGEDDGHAVDGELAVGGVLNEQGSGALANRLAGVGVGVPHGHGERPVLPAPHDRVEPLQLVVHHLHTVVVGDLWPLAERHPLLLAGVGRVDGAVPLQALGEILGRVRREGEYHQPFAGDLVGVDLVVPGEQVTGVDRWRPVDGHAERVDLLLQGLVHLRHRPYAQAEAFVVGTNHADQRALAEVGVPHQQFSGFGVEQLAQAHHRRVVVDALVEDVVERPYPLVAQRRGVGVERGLVAAPSAQGAGVQGLRQVAVAHQDAHRLDVGVVLHFQAVAVELADQRVIGGQRNRGYE